MILRNDCNKEEGPIYFEINDKCYKPEELYIQNNRKIDELVNRIFDLENKVDNIIKVPKDCYKIIYIYTTDKTKKDKTKKFCPISDYVAPITIPFGWEPLENGWFRRGKRYRGYIYTKSFGKTVTGGSPYLTEEEYKVQIKGEVSDNFTIRERRGPHINLSTWLKKKGIR